MTSIIHPPASPPPTRRRPQRRLILTTAILSGALALAVILAPDLVLDGCWHVGYAICHQIRARSLVFGDLQLPLCARCTGTYLGVMLGLTFIALRGRQRSGVMAPIPILIVLVGFIGVMGVDGLNSYLSLIPGMPHAYEPHNFLRVLTGCLNGLALSNIVWPVFGFTFWKQPAADPPLKRGRELLVLLLAALAVVIITYAEIPWLYYPIAIITTLGILTMLGIVNTLIALIILKRESVAEQWRDLATPALIGLALVLVELTFMNALRAVLVHSLGVPLLQ